ncbi:hypothetical protein [Criblamydia sequanensis]|uniref:Uncharacterized protein n=1 Tax=Candidatus Criblamydia sequanensis CRIB-18 TaxID=1437425 RepID=A0A090CZP4_9BACT|nr:hypothetical protein [Criblamydia sequanensis]CDR32930.1 hypothetical protein CSEC_0086 [Criblamydia sequanensis CRIB-18]
MQVGQDKSFPDTDSIIPPKLQEKRRSLELKAEAVQSLGFDTESSKETMGQIIQKAEVEYLIASDNLRINEITQEAHKQLSLLYQTEWPLYLGKCLQFYSALLLNLMNGKKLEEQKESLSLSSSLDIDELKLEGEEESEILTLKEKAEKEKEKLLRQLKETLLDTKRMELIFDCLKSLTSIKKEADFLIKKLFIFDTKEKIILRFRTAIKEENPKFDDFENELNDSVKDMEALLKDFPLKKDPTEKEERELKLITNFLEKKDIELEQEIARLEILEKKKSVRSEISDLEFKVSSLEERIFNLPCQVFKEEKKYVESFVEDSLENLSKVHKPELEGHFNELSQLFVCTSGSLTSLERYKIVIRVKYGLARIAKSLHFHRFIMMYEWKPESFELFDKAKIKLLEDAEEKLTWGMDGKKAYQSNNERKIPVNIPPPLQKLSVIEGIIDFHILEVRKLVAKITADQALSDNMSRTV